MPRFGGDAFDDDRIDALLAAGADTGAVLDVDGTEAVVFTDGHPAFAFLTLEPVFSGWVALFTTLAADPSDRAPGAYRPFDWLEHLDEPARHQFRRELTAALTVALAADAPTGSADTVRELIDGWQQRAATQRSSVELLRTLEPGQIAVQVQRPPHDDADD